MSPLIMLIFVFVGVTGLGVTVVLLFSAPRVSAAEGRLQAFTTQSRGVSNDPAAGHLLAGLTNPSTGMLAGIQLLIDQTGSKMTLTSFVVATGGVSMGGAVVTMFLGAPLIAALIAGACCAVLPLFYLFFLRKRRFAKFGKQLPEALELISRALRAGHSLGAGISLVAEEMPDPIGCEFSKCFEEQNLGMPLEEALESLSDRIPNLDLRFFVTAVVLQRQTGGDLAEILDKIGHLIRERFKIWGQIQALTGEGRLSGIVLLALPPALFVVMYRLNPEYTSELFNDPMGQKMLMGAIVMQLVGALVIRQIINIKV
jgi:tight adherence protein B